MCEVCHGHPNYPVCSPEPRMIECAACQGQGYVWYRYDLEEDRETEVTEKGLRYCQGEKETCSVCDGTGEVEDYELYEPEWDD